MAGTVTADAPAVSAEAQLTDAKPLTEAPLPAGPSDAEIEAAWDSTFSELEGLQQQSDAEKAAEQPAQEQPADAQASEEPAQEPAQEPAPAQPNPYEARVRELEQQNQQMLELLKKTVGRQDAPAVPAAAPKDAVQGFLEAMKRQGLNIEDPKVADTQYKAQLAFHQSVYGMSPDEVKAKLDRLDAAIGSITGQQAVQADQAKTMQALTAAKSEFGLDLFGEHKPHMATVLNQLDKMGAAVTYTQPAVIPPDVAVKLAHYEKMVADQRAAAAKTAKAQGAKTVAKAAASGAAPATAPGQAVGASGLKEGKPLTQEEANSMSVADLIDRMGLI